MMYNAWYTTWASESGVCFMDEDVILDIDEQFAFGDETNDTDAVFTDYAPTQRSQSKTWQRIVEMKSAAHEGYLAYHILCEREDVGLPVYARSLFSVHSPLERFSQATDFFSGTIGTRKVYLEHRGDCLAKLTDLIFSSVGGSQLSLKLQEVKELLAMQLYGFGRAALQEDEITLSLEAFRIAEILKKEKVINYIRDYIVQNPSREAEVLEYLHFHA